MNQPFSYQGLGALLVLAIAAATVWLILYWWERRHDQRPVQPSLESVFTKLCAAHELDEAMTVQLETLARDRKISDPAVLFIDPRPMEQRAIETASDHEVWLELGRKLFGDVFHPATAGDPGVKTLPEM